VEVALFAKKWTQEILWVLEKEPLWFSEISRVIKREGENISSRTLAERLQRLEEEGLVTKWATEEKRSRTFYKITSKGRKLLSLLREIENL
jgi:DNA-binding HxlR family transcriptional regulator